MRPLPRPAVLLSLVAVATAAAASLATLVWRDAFPSPSPAPVVNRVLAEARGWSAATLLVAIPQALLSLRAARRGSTRGRLVWLGSLAYFVYTYLEFAVSPPFTALYLLYITAFACAIPALVMGAASIDVTELPATFGAAVPRRVIAIFSLLVAALLAVAWLKDTVSRTVAGAFGWPFGADAVGHVVRALDLGLQVPLGIAAGILLLRRRPAGYLVAAILLANCACMGGALTAMVAWSSAASGAPVWSAWPFAVAWAIDIGFAIAFFRAGARVLPSGRATAPRPVEGDADSEPAPRSGLAWSAIVLEVLLGIGALGGGTALMLGPHGELLPLPVSALAGSPFVDYFVPGAILFFVIGLGPLVAAALSWKRHPLAPVLATVVGSGLLTWMAVEVAIVGYTNAPPLQAIYFALGAAIVLVGVNWRRQRGATRRPGT